MTRKIIIANVLGFIVAGLGLWGMMPTIGNTIASLPQIIVNEFAWLPMLFGAVVLVWALRKPRAWLAAALAIAGIGLAAQPIMRAVSLGAEFEAAMMRGLGDDYTAAIPDTARMADARFSVLNAVGARNFGSAASLTENVEYFAAPERSLYLDIYHPQVEPAVGDSYPAIIVIHGGSWRWMDKSGVFAPHDRYLASLGYVVFDIQYRFSQEAVWNAQLQDVQCAIAWVRANAENYRVDGSRIALMGRSAGGHLALIVAYRPNDPAVELAACGMEGVDTSVSAVVAYYPPTDMRLYNSPPNGVISDLLSGTIEEVPAAYADSSPTTFVREGLPPTLLIQGYMDDLVLPDNVELLNNLLLAADNAVVVLRVPWGRHGFDFMLGGLGAQMTQYDLDRLLAWSFYRAA